MTPARPALAAIASPAAVGRWIVVAIAWLLAWTSPAEAYKPPPLSGRVVDPAGALGTTASTLDTRLQKVAKERGYELVVFVAPALEGATIEDVAYAAFNAWHLGDAKQDTGILIVIAPAERKIRIETGKGAGGAVTDLQSFGIIERMGPLVAAGQTAAAALLAVDELDALLEKDGARPAPRPKEKTPWWVIVLIVGGVLLVFAIMLLIRRRNAAAAATTWSVFQLVLKAADALSGKKRDEQTRFKGGGGRSGGGGASGSF